MASVFIKQKYQDTNRQHDPKNPPIDDSSLSVASGQDLDNLYQLEDVDTLGEYACNYQCPDVPLIGDEPDAELIKKPWATSPEQHQKSPDSQHEPIWPEIPVLENMQADLYYHSRDTPQDTFSPLPTPLLGSPRPELHEHDHTVIHGRIRKGDSGRKRRSAVKPRDKATIVRNTPHRVCSAEDLEWVCPVEPENVIHPQVLGLEAHQDLILPFGPVFSGHVTSSGELESPQIPYQPMSLAPVHWRQNEFLGASKPAHEIVPVDNMALPVIGSTGIHMYNDTQMLPLPRNDIMSLPGTANLYPEIGLDLWKSIHQSPRSTEQFYPHNFTHAEPVAPERPKAVSLNKRGLPKRTRPVFPVFANETIAHRQYTDTLNNRLPPANPDRKSGPEVKLSNSRYPRLRSVAFADHKPTEIGTGMQSGRNHLAEFADLLPNEDGKQTRGLRHSLIVKRGRTGLLASQKHLHALMPLPAGITLETVCKDYPNHVWGDMLRVFLCENWEGRDIWELLPEYCRHNSLEKNRPWNYLQKAIERECIKMYEETTGLEWATRKPRKPRVYRKVTAAKSKITEDEDESSELSSPPSDLSELEQARDTPNLETDQVPTDGRPALSIDISDENEIWRSTLRSLDRIGSPKLPTSGFDGPGSFRASSRDLIDGSQTDSNIQKT